MDREAIQAALKTARGVERCELALKEALHRLLDDKNAASAAELLKDIADDGDHDLSVHARLLLGHAYRSMGKRRTAVFTYQRIARRQPADDPAVMALVALVEIGDATVAKVARQRLDEIIADPERPPAADLIAGGQAFDALEEFFAGE